MGYNLAKRKMITNTSTVTTFAQNAILKRIIEKKEWNNRFQDYYDKDGGYGDGWQEYVDTDNYSTDYNDCSYPEVYDDN